MYWASDRNAMSRAPLASFAIRSSFVETFPEDCDSAIFPSNGSMIRCRSLLRWVPRVGSPPSQLVLRHSDFRRPPLALLVARRSGCRSSATRRRISQVPGLPLPACRVLRPRWGRSRPCLFRDGSLLFGRFAVACRGLEHVGPHETQSFEAPSHGSQARCLRFATGVALRPRARLASGWAASPWPDGTDALKSRTGQLRKVSVYRLPLSPSFAWRTPPSCCILSRA